MAQLKAHEVERYLAKINPEHRVFLIYGPDSGMVSERAKLIAKETVSDINDPYSTIKIQADEAAADPHRITDEAFTVPMFGGNRLVWIQGSTQKNLIAALQPVLDNPPTDSLILVEAGDLKKSSPLRTRIEKSTSSIALPCYQDQTRSIADIVDANLKSAGLRIDIDARLLLISMLGGDRLASKAELDKLCLYASGNESISVDDVTAAVGDAGTLDIDTVIDSASIGDMESMDHMLKRMFSRGVTVFAIVSAAQRHFQMLHRVRCHMQHSGQPVSAAVGGMKPPVNFQRKDKIARALSIWSVDGLERLLKRLDSVSLESRSKANLAVPLVSTALMAITLEAARNTRR